MHVSLTIFLPPPGNHKNHGRTSDTILHINNSVGQFPQGQTLSIKTFSPPSHLIFQSCKPLLSNCFQGGSIIALRLLLTRPAKTSYYYNYSTSIVVYSL